MGFRESGETAKIELTYSITERHQQSGPALETLIVCIIQVKTVGSDRWSSGGPAEEKAQKSLRVEWGGKRWLRESEYQPDGKLVRLKRTVLAVEYCVVRATGFDLQEAR